jgi:hypothetical protein
MNTCTECGATETCRWYGGPTCNRCHGRSFRAKNPDYHREYQQDYNQLDFVKNKNAKRSHAYYLANKPKRIEKERIYQSNRLKNDILFRLKRNLRARLNKAVQFEYKSGSAVDDLGCSIEEFKKHLESKFYPNLITGEVMSWSNYGDWHVDHITSLASFDLSNPDQVKQACHYTNLQPLWAEENLKKGDK